MTTSTTITFTEVEKMSNTELKKEIKKLKTRVGLLEEYDTLKQRLCVLERELDINQNPYTVYPIITTNTFTSCTHEYPNPWHGTVPPSCIRCGKQAPSNQVMCTTVDSFTISGIDFSAPDIQVHDSTYQPESELK